MRLSCPACGAEMTLDVLIATEAAREAVLAALALPPPLGKLLVQYMALFRPPKRQLSFDRLAVLFAELALPIADGRIERKGRAWSAPLEYWRAALEEIISKREKLTLPLKSHGYLLEIIVGYSSKAEAAAENLREQSRARGHSVERHSGGTIGEVIARQMPERVREQLRGLGVLKRGEKDGE